MAITKTENRLYTAGLKTTFQLSLWLILVVWQQDLLAVNKQVEAIWSGKSLAVIVNDNDRLSRQIADYYQAKRNIPDRQMIHVRFKPGSTVLSVPDFSKLKRQVDSKIPATVQGLVITWLLPFRVDCMSITTAFAAGFDQSFCAQGCVETRHNPYFDSNSSRPFDDFGWRPTIVLAGKDFAEVKALIDRGVSADYSQPEGAAYLLKTADHARNSRALVFPELIEKFKDKFPVNYLETGYIENRQDVMFYFTGATRVKKINQNTYLPGAVADHLTSSGGVLNGKFQMTILEWIQAGVTGSYGTVIEPCNFAEKFSNPNVLMDHYLKGETLIEAYWKSVSEPGQGVFIGEPLAKPFAKATNK